MACAAISPPSGDSKAFDVSREFQKDQKVQKKVQKVQKVQKDKKDQKLQNLRRWMNGMTR